MEIDLYGNHLKLENNEIYNYRQINPNSKKKDWYKIIFSINNHGYLFCNLTNNKVKRGFLFHRLMYYFYNQEWDIFNKKLVIDHVDRNPLNNNIDNLRVVTQQENTFNSNAKGCYFNKEKKKWDASIRINRKKINLGYYKTEQEAHEVYLEAKKKYHIIIQNIV
jgi:hypothetical protein